MKWTSDTPTRGWWFQRWKESPDSWFIVEVVDGVILATGNVRAGDIERAQYYGGEWAGPIELPHSLKDTACPICAGDTVAYCCHCKNTRRVPNYDLE